MGRAHSFWDRRRAGVAAEAEAETAALTAREAEAEQVALEDRPDAEILAELNLPDPDTLKMGDDFTGFMARQVPARLRNRALRRLWRSNPVLACVDGLNDYDGDYLTGSTGNGVIATSYKVGKGMLAHIDTLTRESAPPEENIEEEAAPEPDVVLAEASAEPEAPTIEAPTEEAETAPRRMRFRFDEGASA